MTNTFARGISESLDTVSLASNLPRGHAASADFKQRLNHYLRRPLQRAVPLVFAAGIAAALMTGFLARGEQHITPEEGTGYWLGIAGAIMMLMLMLYPLRKRYPALRVLGPVGSWFRLHMLLGVLGPTLILFHANFQLSSVNATAATLSMLLVVASGVIGRYLYSRVHLGLYGRRAEMRELLDDIAQIESELLTQSGGDQGFVARLQQLESLLPPPDATTMQSLRSTLQMRRAARRAVSELSRHADSIIRARAQRERWSRRQKREAKSEIDKGLSMFRRAMLKTASLTFYTRMFALWHVLHLPLFILLIGTAILHVIAVHLY